MEEKAADPPRPPSTRVPAVAHGSFFPFPALGARKCYALDQDAIPQGGFTRRRPPRRRHDTGKLCHLLPFMTTTSVPFLSPAPAIASGPTVTIIVPCRNEREHIEGTLNEILALDEPAGGCELIVADGMSDDGTREVLARMANDNARLRVIDNTGQIVSTGLNRAIQASRGSIIIRMDAHTSYAHDYLQRCVDTLLHTCADNVGGPWVAKGTGRTGGAIAAAFNSPFASGGSRGHRPSYEGPVDTVYLGCWPRRVFDQFGPFDEELVRNQDDEYNLRLARSGGMVWQSCSIKSSYTVRGSLRALLRQYLQYGYWKVRIIQKHRMPASFRHLVPAAFVLALTVLAVASPFLQPAAIILGMLFGAYVATNATASIRTAARSSWAHLPLLPAIFASFHFGYGIGFLHGLVDFVVIRQRASRHHTTLTRESKRGGVL